MTGLNKYYKRSNISEITGISRVTINKIFLIIRIANLCEQASPLSGKIELDEAYFGAKRIHCKRGCGADGKTIVFGLLKRDGKVYTVVVEDTKKKTLMPVIER